MARPKINCSELTQKEQLALASSISEELEGRAIALVRDEDIVIDRIGGKDVSAGELEGLARAFVSRRKDGGLYSVRMDGPDVIIRSPDPVAAKSSRGPYEVPPGAFQCPACGAVLPDEGRYQIHLRVHDLLRGAASG